MLRFVIGTDRARENPWIRYAAFELGVRLNLRFTIQSTALAANPEDILLWYGSAEHAASPLRSLRMFCLPIGMACEATLRDGRWCYGSAVNGELDVIAGAAALLSFACEAGAKRDALGRVAPETHPLRATFCEPLLENNAAYLKNQIERRFGALKPESSPFGEGRGACVLTHDVDGPQLHTFFALARCFVRGLQGDHDELASLGLGLSTLLASKPDPYWNFAQWADLEKSMGGRSTFFVYPGPTSSASRNRKDPHYHPARGAYPAALRALAANGWEIGAHHGIDAHGVPAYTEAREALRQIADIAPAGCRSHYWSGVWQDPHQAWEEMQHAGFRYDASLSPLTLGYRAGNMLPLMPSMRRPSGVSDGFVVLPTALMDSYANPRLSSLSAAEIHKALERLTANARSAGLLVADWHVRTLVDSGAHRGQMSSFLSTVRTLASDPSVVLMTAQQVAESWRLHCGRCYVEAH